MMLHLVLEKVERMCVERMWGSKGKGGTQVGASSTRLPVNKLLADIFVLVGFDLLMGRPSRIRTLSNVLILESNNCGMHGFWLNCDESKEIDCNLWEEFQDERVGGVGAGEQCEVDEDREEEDSIWWKCCQPAWWWWKCCLPAARTSNAQPWDGDGWVRPAGWVHPPSNMNHLMIFIITIMHYGLSP